MAIEIKNKICQQLGRSVNIYVNNSIEWCSAHLGDVFRRVFAEFPLRKYLNVWLLIYFLCGHFRFEPKELTNFFKTHSDFPI